MNELYRSTIGENADDQAQKGTQLLEIYALEIQMHNERKNYKKLKVSPILGFGRLVLIRLVVVGDLQRIQHCALCDSTSSNHGRDQRVWREDVDGRTCVFGESEDV